MRILLFILPLSILSCTPSITSVEELHLEVKVDGVKSVYNPPTSFPLGFESYYNGTDWAGFNFPNGVYFTSGQEINASLVLSDLKAQTGGQTCNVGFTGYYAENVSISINSRGKVVSDSTYTTSDLFNASGNSLTLYGYDPTAWGQSPWDSSKTISLSFDVEGIRKF